MEELIRSPLVLEGVLVAPQLESTKRGVALRAALADRGVQLAEVSEREFDSAAETDSPQGVLAIAAVPARSLSGLHGDGSRLLLVLDAVQDPGNVGTILRTAAALGVSATFALPGTVDLWNAKVVRSAMGAHFSHHALHCTWDELHSFLRDASIPLWAADTGGEPIAGLERPARLALAVGNEGSGSSDAVRSAAERVVSLPLASGIESLNVAVAAGILLYELRR